MKTKINLRIDYELKDELEDLAYEMGTNISGLVRDILIEYINEYNDIDRPPPIIIDVSKYLGDYKECINQCNDHNEDDDNDCIQEMVITPPDYLGDKKD